MNNQHGTPPNPHVVTVRSLDEHLSSDQSFSSAYARAVGAIAGNEGSLTLAQFAAVTDIAGDGKSSAVFTARAYAELKLWSDDRCSSSERTVTTWEFGGVPC